MSPTHPHTHPETLEIVCAWCGATLRQGAAGAYVSHGICYTCSQTMMGDHRPFQSECGRGVLAGAGRFWPPRMGE